ncbi:MAG TPA: mechanosensitive ion channel [Ottowia sp.]|uniref:mechanosensitive ion channel family protein n=1 Tax=Ottowia sp. TaxID=1898956 RepID=UPI002BF7BD4B|nr:mechanosensitive ion channel domain-containing protein [Ottowia sp.]HMN22433.1 mechanosensitive ion channel [Ottowia sp.]
MTDGSALSFETPWVQALGGLALLLAIAWLLQWLAQVLLTRGLARLGPATPSGLATVLLHPKVLHRAAQIVPTLVVQVGVRSVPGLAERPATVIANVAAALTVLCVARLLFKMLDVTLDAQDGRRPDAVAEGRSIKAWVQFGQLVVAIAAVVIMIAALADKSPLIVLSGFGALSAVLMLVFQDTIRSFVAGLQIERNDLLRVGDWMEMPQAGADGAVIDIALNIVRVQNWDKTIVTVPTWRLMTESFKNWRGMTESGGRRIKRALMLDASTIRFLGDEDIARLGRIALIAGYMKDKVEAVQAARVAQARELGATLAALPANQRRLTNIGTFRAYVEAYLRAHPGIHVGMSLMVRQLQPTAQGVPLELYCFTNTTVWAEYEGIQSDIFDHLLAILPEFGLGAFQSPSDAGVRQALGARSGERPAGAGDVLAPP